MVDDFEEIIEYDNTSKLKNLPSNINLDIGTDLNGLSSERRWALIRAVDFSKRISNIVHEKTQKILPDITKSEKIRDLINEKGLDLPILVVMDSARGNEFLTENEFGDKANIKADEALVIFKLPKPLEKWWQKGGINNWVKRAIDVKGMVIEWGQIYGRVMPKVWEETGKSGIFLPIVTRINEKGQHTDSYYYLWKVKSSSIDIPASEPIE